MFDSLYELEMNNVVYSFKFFYFILLGLHYFTKDLYVIE